MLEVTRTCTRYRFDQQRSAETTARFSTQLSHRRTHDGAAIASARNLAIRSSQVTYGSVRVASRGGSQGQALAHEKQTGFRVRKTSLGRRQPTPWAQQRAGLPRILVVEDNPGYRTVISHLVDVAGGKVTSVATISQARHELDDGKRFDIVIVGTSAKSQVTPEDLGMLRSVAQSRVIVLVEGHSETKKALEAYKIGADYVLTKPFAPDLLIATIKEETRKPDRVPLFPTGTRLEFGRFTFDAEGRTVSGNEGTVSLSKREWQLLSFLVANPNQLFVAREALLHAWGPHKSVEQFRIYVSRIRKKLLIFNPDCVLETERGKGYRLVVQHRTIPGLSRAVGTPLG